jgi:hypothetical protein
LGNNDITGLSANAISIDDGGFGGDAAGYLIGGNGITLGAGGLSATTSSTQSGGASLQMPIALGASQTWSIDGGSSQAGQLSIGGNVTGSSSALALNLSNQGFLNFAADAEVGAVTATGSGFGGGVGLGVPGTPGSLNGTDGNGVSLTGSAFSFLIADAVGDTIGPLTVSNWSLQLGAPKPATLAVNGAATLDSTSSFHAFIDQAGTAAGTDYSQLSATGAVNLGSASLNLPGSDLNNPGSCPVLHVGDVDTLVTTTGSLTGTFSGVPEGSTVALQCSPGTAPTVRINYTVHTVTATVLTSGAGTPPSNTSPPTTSGSTTQGQTLSEGHGSWTNSPTSFSYQWEDCDAGGNSCSGIAGATGQTYTLTAADVGHTIRVQETAANADGSGMPAVSAQTAVVQAASSGGTTGGGTATTTGGGTDKTPPTVASFGVSAHTFFIGSLLPKLASTPVGTTISFKLSEKATVTLSFLQFASGRKKGSRCVLNGRTGKRCTISYTRGKLVVSGKTGLNKLRFQGRLSRSKALKPGKYTMVISAKDAAGNVSRSQKTTVTLKKKK